MFDLVLRGGWVVDGTGAPPFRADLALAADRVAAVGRLPEDAAVSELDVTGRYLLPGFAMPMFTQTRWPPPSRCSSPRSGRA